MTISSPSIDIDILSSGTLLASTNFIQNLPPKEIESTRQNVGCNMILV